MTLSNEFSEYVRDIGVNTQKNYLTYIRQLPWMSSEEIKAETDDKIVDTLTALLKSENEVSRGMMRHSFIKLLLMVNRESLKVRIPKYKRPGRKIGKKFLPFSQIKACVDSTGDLQMKLLIMCQYDVCCRISALLGLKRANVVVNDKSKLPEMLSIYEVKTKKNRMVVMSTLTSQLMQEYIKTLECDDVFNLKYKKVWYEQKKLFRQVLGVQGDVVSSHWFRGSRAVHLFQQGYDIDTVKRYGGWEGAAVLDYLNMSGVEVSKVMKESNPKW